MASDSSVVPSINQESEDHLRKLVDFGNAFLDPPASDIELLGLLEEFRLILSRANQGDEKIFSSSFGPSKNALMGNQLLRHANTDVQIAVLSCINEITRITAPEWPYKESEMKEFFLLLVELLKRFFSMNDHCHAKVVSILETVAGTKSCLIMLDLNMGGPIQEMFRNFLISIQLRPSPAVFSDMVTIMTTLLQEQEEGIPVDLLSTLLTSVKKDRKDVSPISWAMGVQILQNSARHVQPFLTNLVQTLQIDLNEYAEIVASICQNAAQAEHRMCRELALDSAGPSGQLVDGPSKSVENNSTTCDMDSSISIDQSSLKIMQFGSQITKSTLTDNATIEGDDKPLKDEYSQKDLNSGPTKEKNTADLKTISEAENVIVTVPKEHNIGAQDLDHNISSEQNASKTLQFSNQTTAPPSAENVSNRKGDGSPLKDENFLMEQTSGGTEVEKGTDLETISTAENENNAASQDNNDGAKITEKRERKPNSLFRMEEGYYFAGKIDESGFLKSPCSWKNYKRRSSRSSNRKSNAVSLVNKSVCDENPRRKRTSKKNGNVINQHDPKQKQLSFPSPSVCKKRSRGKSARPTNCSQGALETSSQFEVVLASSYLTTKKAPESECKGELSSSKEEASQMTYGEKLVGYKIKVWWPLDQEYYEGSVVSFDPSTMEHKVFYDDGDIETLKLMLEDWHLVKEATLLDGQEEIRGPYSSDLNFSNGPSSKKQKENSNGENIAEFARASAE